MLFSYGVHTKDKGKNLKCFLLRCNLFVSVSFLPPVILVMIDEALYIKVVKRSRLRASFFYVKCNHLEEYSPQINPQGGSVTLMLLSRCSSSAGQKRALSHKRLEVHRKGGGEKTNITKRFYYTLRCYF